LAAQPKGDPVGGSQALEGAHDQVGPVGRHVEPAGVEGELARLFDLELEEERHGRRQHVVTRPEVGRGGRHAHEAVPRGHSNTARSTAPRWFSQLITAGALESAVSGSLRPWPVRTQTTDSGSGAPSTVGSPWASSPATEAAEAGSQKTP